jgi:hypothetical protein
MGGRSRSPRGRRPKFDGLEGRAEDETTQFQSKRTVRLDAPVTPDRAFRDEVRKLTDIGKVIGALIQPPHSRRLGSLADIYNDMRPAGPRPATAFSHTRLQPRERRRRSSDAMFRCG